MTIETSLITFQHTKLDSSQEHLQQDYFNVEVVTSEFVKSMDPRIDVFHGLTYGRYTPEQKPIPVTVPVSSSLSSLYDRSERTTAYVLATGNLGGMLEKPLDAYTKSIEIDLEPYTRAGIGGIFRVDYGTFVPGNNLPNEAMVLLRGHNWPTDKTIGYAGSFSPHPLLSRQHGLNMLNSMLNKLYELAAKEGFSNEIYAIFAPHVRKHVIKSGSTVADVESKHELNRGDYYADFTFNTWPRYWTMQPEPKLYKLVPSELNQK